MAQGKSGRVVIEIEPTLKSELYVELARHQLTMKDWFIKNASQLVSKGRRGLLKRDSKLIYQKRRG